MADTPAPKLSWTAQLAHVQPLLAVGLSLFWSLCGGFITLLVLRVLLVDRLLAETTARARADSAQVDRLGAVELVNAHVASALDSIRVQERLDIRALCSDHTRMDQEKIGLNCPPNLYLGGH